MKKRKKAQTIDLFSIIFGLIVIAGGVMIIFNYWVLGGFLAGLGVLAELIKKMVEGGVLQ